MMWGVTAATVRFGAGPRAGTVRALTGVSLQARKGAIRSVVGGDGAGKTTLLNVLIGRVIPAVGTVNAPETNAIGFMPSTSGVWQDLSVEENVAFVGHAYGMSGAGLIRRRDELLERAELTGALSRLGSQLSGGMRQKLGFCLALLHEPELVVLDEPSTGVDPVSRIELWRLITEAAAQGMAVVMTSTYLDEAERAEEVLVLDEGTTLYSGPPTDIAANVPGAIYSIASEESRADASELSWRRGLSTRTWSAESLALHGSSKDDERGAAIVPDLEDAVIALTLARRFAPGSNGIRDAEAPTSGASGTRTAQSTIVTSVERQSRKPDPAADPIVNIAGVLKRFGDFTALDEAGLTVKPGEVVGLVGANGAGKTTLIRILLGLEAPDAGRVQVFGQRPSRASRSRLGYMPQGLGLYEELSVAQNVDFVVGAFGVQDPPCLPEALARVADRPVESIGLGLQRQLAFHCALVHRPELLVLDEPTSGVDPLSRARLWDTIRASAETGTAALVTTHYMQEAEQCDRLILLAHGEVVASGRQAEIIGDTRTMVVEGGSWQQTFDVLSSAGLIVTLAGTQVRVVGSSRDEVAAVLGRQGLSDLSLIDAAATLEERLALTG